MPFLPRRLARQRDSYFIFMAASNAFSGDAVAIVFAA